MIKYDETKNTIDSVYKTGLRTRDAYVQGVYSGDSSPYTSPPHPSSSSMVTYSTDMAAG